MDTKFTDRKIVGWYHSHPNYGIFLSDRDRFCQDSTFNSPGQIAYVVDPVNGLEGVFCWRGGESKLLPHFWVGDEIHLSSRDKDRRPSSAPLPETPAPPPRQDAPVHSSLLPLLLALVCLLLGYLLGDMRSEQEQRQIERGAVAYFGRIKGLKPGMREDLETLHNAMLAIAHDVSVLSEDHLKLVGDKVEERKKEWDAVKSVLKQATEGVQQINNKYSLKPEESKVVQDLIDQQEAEFDLGHPPPGAPSPKSSGSQSSTKSSGEPATAKPTSAPTKPSGDKTAVPAPPSPMR